LILKATEMSQSRAVSDFLYILLVSMEKLECKINLEQITA